MGAGPVEKAGEILGAEATQRAEQARDAPAAGPEQRGEIRMLAKGRV